MFKKAIRKQAFLRLALMGTAGSGKTYTALLLAKHLGCRKIAVIDSERGSAKLYSDLVDFDVCELESFAAERYIDAIVFAERAGYDCIIIDSLSHAWAGKDGILEYKDKRTDVSRSKDSFGAGWRDATPLHNKLVDSILAFKGHVIATLRTKTEYVLEAGANGKMTPRRVGMAPVQRDGVEYEFTVVGDFIEAEKLEITKTRCSALAGQLLTRPGREMAETLVAWLNSGEAVEADAPAAVAAPAPAPIRMAPVPPPDAPTPRSAADKAVKRYPWIADDVGRTLARTDIDDAAKIDEMKRLCGKAAAAEREAANAPSRTPAPAAAPTPAAPAPREPAYTALDTEARKLLAAAEHDDPPARAKVAELLQRWSQGRGTVDGIDLADLGGFVSEVSAVLNGPAVAA